MAQKTYPSGRFPSGRHGKRAARLLIYICFLRAIGKRKFMTRAHLVLGGSGGDIEFLLTLGVPAENIWVAEKRSFYAGRLAAKYPGCHVFADDVLDVAAHLSARKVPIATINLDYCSKLRSAVVERSAAVLKLLGGWLPAFAITFSGAREQEEDVRVLISAEKERLANHADVPDGYVNPAARCTTLRKMLRRCYSLTSIHTCVLYRSARPTTQRKRGVSTSMAVCVGYRRRRMLSDVNNMSFWVAEETDDRKIALELRRFGFRAPEVAPLLDRPRQQVAGWFAVKTKLGIEHGKSVRAGQHRKRMRNLGCAFLYIGLIAQLIHEGIVDNTLWRAQKRLAEIAAANGRKLPRHYYLDVLYELESGRAKYTYNQHPVLH